MKTRKAKDKKSVANETFRVSGQGNLFYSFSTLFFCFRRSHETISLLIRSQRLTFSKIEWESVFFFLSPRPARCFLRLSGGPFAFVSHLNIIIYQIVEVFCRKISPARCSLFGNSISELYNHSRIFTLQLQFLLNSVCLHKDRPGE